MNDTKKRIVGANPFMPLWEHVPDGEPRVFTHNGETRVYLYGSHDTMKTEYCGKDQVVWSAPVNELTKWKCHGVCYKSVSGGILYAPDVVYRNGSYYMYAAEDRGSKIYVAVSDNPAGPFINPVLTQLGFDPGILVDDDNRVYAYWGFCGCFCAELNDDMATIKEGTLHEAPMGHCISDWNTDTKHVNIEDGFFEASSIRKIMGKYVYIYSKRYNTPVERLGVTGECNGFLSYKYSDRPLENFKPGGDISFNGGEIVKLDDNKYHMTYRWGNNHGSLCEINGKWYIFYHRHTGINEYSRQAMMEPVDIAADESGRIFIGKIEYENKGGKISPVSSGVVEMTSSGPMLDGIDAYSIISAGYACHIFRSGDDNEPDCSSKAYIKPVYRDEASGCKEMLSAEYDPDDKQFNPSSPIVNIMDGYTVGFRYIQFGENNSNQTVNILVDAIKDIKINIRTGSHRGEIVGSVEVKGGNGEKAVANAENLAAAKLCKPVNGRAAVYFEFLALESVQRHEEIARFIEFDFDR